MHGSVRSRALRRRRHEGGLSDCLILAGVRGPRVCPGLLLLNVVESSFFVFGLLGFGSLYVLRGLFCQLVRFSVRSRVLRRRTHGGGLGDWLILAKVRGPRACPRPLLLSETESVSLCLVLWAWLFVWPVWAVLSVRSPIGMGRGGTPSPQVRRRQE